MFRLTALVGNGTKQWAYLTEEAALAALTKVQQHFAIKPQTGNLVRIADDLKVTFYCKDGSVEHLHFQVSEA